MSVSAKWDWIESQASDTIAMPSYLVIGDQWVFQRAIGQYQGYTGQMTFAAGSDRIAATATSDGEDFTWTFAGADTATLPPQPYLWTVTVSDVNGNRLTLQSGGVRLLSDISLNPPLQTQSMLQQQLAACDQTLLKLFSQQAQTVAYAGQTYSMHNLKELWGIRNDLANRVSQEQAKFSGNSRSNRIIPRFVFR